MNYEKMWNDFKSHLTNEALQMQKGGQYISLHEKLLAHMSMIEATEYRREPDRHCGRCEPDENAGRKEMEKKPEADRKPEPKEILRKVFGSDYADSLKDLENKMKGKTGGMIFVDPEVEFTEDILNEAKARGTSIAHVSCQELCMEIPGSRPPFLNGGRFA